MHNILHRRVLAQLPPSPLNHLTLAVIQDIMCAPQRETVALMNILKVKLRATQIPSKLEVWTAAAIALLVTAPHAKYTGCGFGSHG